MAFDFADLISPVTDLIGGTLNRKETRNANNKNNDLQRDFAQNSVRWKVEDAKRAGIHPIYALGAPTMSANPSYVGDTSLGQSISNAGQNISSSINKTRTSDERTSSVMEQLQIERGGLENELLRSQIARINQTSNPPMPGSDYIMPGQPQSGLSKRIPSQYTASVPGQPHMEAAPPTPGGKKFAYPYGLNVTLPSKDAKDAIEDVLPYELEHYYLHRIAPGIEKLFTEYPQAAGRFIAPYLKKLWNSRKSPYFSSGRR